MKFLYNDHLCLAFAQTVESQAEQAIPRRLGVVHGDPVEDVGQLSSG